MQLLTSVGSLLLLSPPRVVRAIESKTRSSSYPLRPPLISGILSLFFFAGPNSCCTRGRIRREVTLVEKTIDSGFLAAEPERLIGDRAYDSNGLDER